MFVDRPLLEVKQSKFGNMYEPKYNERIPSADGLFHVRSVQQQKVNIDENGIPNTIPVDRGADAFCTNTNDIVDKVRKAIKGEVATIND